MGGFDCCLCSGPAASQFIALDSVIVGRSVPERLMI